MSLAKRLEKLEGTKHTANQTLIIFRTCVGVSENGPENLGIINASILKGGKFSRADYPTDEAFKNAVSENYTSTYKEPLKWNGDEVFCDIKA